jgi:hypothetical protein
MADRGKTYSSFAELLDLAVSDQEKYANSANTLQYFSDRNDQAVNKPLIDTSPYIPEARSGLVDEIKTSKEDETLYGFIPGDWLHPWVKEGYNNSLEGLSYELATGKKKFDLSKYDTEDRGILGDITASLVSFLVPSDFVTVAFGGGLGGAVVRAGAKKTAIEAIKLGVREPLKRGIARESVESVVKGNTRKATEILMKNNIKKDVAEQVVGEASKRVSNKLYAEVAQGATSLGFYSGLRSALGQKIEVGDIDAVQTLLDTGQGAIMGAVPAATAKPLVNAVNKKIFDSTLGSTTKAIATKAVETTEFGTMTGLFEGRLPRVEDYAHAAGVIGGMYIAKKIPSKAMELAGRENLPLTSREYAKQRAEVEYGVQRKSQIFTDKDGIKINNVEFIKPQEGAGKKGIKVKARILKDGVETGNIEMTGSEFSRRKFSRRKINSDKVNEARQKEAFGRKGKLKLSDQEFKAEIEGAIGRKVGDDRKTGWSTLTDIEKVKVLDNLRKQSLTEKIAKAFKQEGYEDYLIPQRKATAYLKQYGEFLMQVKNRAVSPGGVQVLDRINKADARGITKTGTYLQKLQEYKLYRGGMFSKIFGSFVVDTPTGKKKIRTESQAKKYFEDLGRRMADPSRQNDKDVKRLRSVLDEIYRDAKKAGVPVMDYRKNYFPNHIKQEYLDKIGNDIFKFINEDMSLHSTSMDRLPDITKKVNDIYKSDRVKLDSVTKQAIDHLKKFFQRKDNGGLSEDQAIAKAWMQLRDTVYKQRYSIHSKLEKKRKAELPDEFYQRDARVVLTKYASDAGKRIAHVEFFGPKNEWFMTQRETLVNLRNQAVDPKKQVLLAREIKLIDQAFDSFTNMIEFDPTKNWGDPRAKNFFKGLVDFEVGTKIGLGFATIPNVTQTLISTAVKAGYYNTFKGVLKLADPSKSGKEYRALVGRSGISTLSVFQMLSGLEPSSSLMGKFANFTTRLGFQQMNKVNQLVSAAAGYEYTNALLKARNSRISWRRNWARKSLQELGLDPKIKKLTERQNLETMYKFSRDSQLQRNVLNDPLFFNDPRFRPFVLFKRFGVRQFNWIRETLSAEFMRGNVMPILRLGVGGMWGSHFVIWSKKALNELLTSEDYGISTLPTGQRVYDENRLFIPGLPKGTKMDDYGADSNVDMSEFTMSDFFDHVSSVGAFGFIADIVASENKFRAVEFLLKPAIIQDALKGVDAMQRIYKDMEDYGMGAGKRSIKYLAPLLGTVPRRVATRFETPGQRETYRKYRRGLIKSRILDLMQEGKSKQAYRMIDAWNRSNPSDAFYIEDVGIDAQFERAKRKAEKRANP